MGRSSDDFVADELFFVMSRSSNIHMSNGMLERNLPSHLAHDLEAWKKVVEGKSCQFYKTYLVARCEVMF